MIPEGRRMFIRLSLIAIFAAAPLSTAFAQGTPQQRAACRADVVKFCKGKGDDAGVLLSCLQENKDKISEKCRKVVDEHTLGFADYRGNRQYITLGNLSENERAYLFLIDFSRRQRIKLWGRARVVENDDALIEKLFDHSYKAKPERVILFTIEAWDVNCSQHITARLSEEDVERMAGTIQQRFAALQAENARLRAALAQ